MVMVGVLAADGDSPQQNVPDFAYSPNPHNGSSGSDKNNSEPEPKAKVVPRRDAPPTKPTHSISLAASAPSRKRQQKESSLDLERLASTRKRFMRISRKLRIDTLLYFGFTSILFGLYFCHKRTFCNNFHIWLQFWDSNGMPN
ncbi:hypothetical protein ACSBR2_014109 [Camellia fascicularis]